MIERNKEEQAKFPWQTFWCLLILFVVAAIAMIPHARAVLLQFMTKTETPSNSIIWAGNIVTALMYFVFYQDGAQVISVGQSDE